jgi:hypothetical protein
MIEEESDGRLHTTVWSPVPLPGVLVHDEYDSIDWDASLRNLLDDPLTADTFMWVQWLRGAALPASARPLLAQLISRCESWLAAFRAEAIASVDAGLVDSPPPPTGRPEPIDKRDSSRPDRATLDVALAIRATPGSAAREIARAHQLERMPLLRAKLQAGCITWVACGAILDNTMWLNDDELARVDARIAGHRSLSHMTWGKATNLAKREAAAADPDGAQSRERERRQDADVHLDKVPGGPGARLTTTFSDIDGAVVMAEIERLAAVLQATKYLTAPEARIEAHRRLVLAGAAALHACPSCSAVADKVARSSRRKAGRMQVQVQVPLDTAMGVSDAPGWIVGWGPVEAETLRQRIFDPDLAIWSRLVFDPLSGTLLDYGRTTYRPPAPLRRFVVTRDGGCTNPVCERTHRDADVDLDHLQEWENGGATSAANLGSGHEACHVGRHATGWTITHDAEQGTVTWTDRFGNSYTGELADHRPPPTKTDADRKAWLLSLLAEQPKDRRPRQHPRKTSTRSDAGDGPPGFTDEPTF